MTPSIVQTLHLFANLLPNWTLISILTLLPNFGGFHGTLQRVRLANRGRLLLRTPGPVPFGTCICSNVETILSWTCHVYGPFEFRTSLGTSIFLSREFWVLASCQLLSNSVWQWRSQKCPCQSEAWAAFFGEGSARKTKTWWMLSTLYLIPEKFLRILLSGCREVENLKS